MDDVKITIAALAELPGRQIRELRNLGMFHCLTRRDIVNEIRFLGNWR